MSTCMTECKAAGREEGSRGSSDTKPMSYGFFH